MIFKKMFSIITEHDLHIWLPWNAKTIFNNTRYNHQEKRKTYSVCIQPYFSFEYQQQYQTIMIAFKSTLTFIYKNIYKDNVTQTR